MTNDNNIFTLRFFGNEVSPESFSLKELGSLLSSIEDGVKAIVDSSYPAEDAEDVFLSLTTIKNESNSLGIYSGNDISSLGVVELARSIQSNTYTNLPKKAYESYTEIHKIVQRKQCKAELLYKGETLYVVTPETEIIKQENVLIEIDTVIYGELLKLGIPNAESLKPKVWVELLEGKVISFSVSKEQATELSPHIFKTVALKGRIKWNALTKTTIGFKLYDIVPYKQGNVSKGFEQLRDISSGFWDTLKTDEDINNHLKGD